MPAKKPWLSSHKSRPWSVMCLFHGILCGKCVFSPLGERLHLVVCSDEMSNVGTRCSLFLSVDILAKIYYKLAIQGEHFFFSNLYFQICLKVTSDCVLWVHCVRQYIVLKWNEVQFDDLPHPRVQSPPTV